MNCKWAVLHENKDRLPINSADVQEEKSAKTYLEAKKLTVTDSLSDTSSCLF